MSTLYAIFVGILALLAMVTAGDLLSFRPKKTATEGHAEE